MLLTQRIRKSCPQSEIFSLGGQYYGLGQSILQICLAAILPKRTSVKNVLSIYLEAKRSGVPIRCTSVSNRIETAAPKSTV